LEFVICESLATYTFEFVIAQSSLQKITELIVKVGVEVTTVIPANASYLVSKDLLQILLLDASIDA